MKFVSINILSILMKNTWIDWGQNEDVTIRLISIPVSVSGDEIIKIWLITG